MPRRALAEANSSPEGALAGCRPCLSRADVSRGGASSRRPDTRRRRAPGAARGSWRSRWSGSRACWPSNAGACGESRRIVRRRTNGMCAKACEVLRFPCRGRAVWAWRRSCCSSRVGRSSVVSVPGRGSESYRFQCSVDALTCGPTRRSPRRIEHGGGSPACQMLEAALAVDKAPFDPSQEAESQAASKRPAGRQRRISIQIP